MISPQQYEDALSYYRGVAHRMCPAHAEDLIGEAGLALCRHAQRWDPSVNGHLGKSALMPVRTAMIDYLRRNVADKRYGIVREGLPLDLRFRAPERPTAFERLPSLRILSDRQRDVLDRIYWREETVSEIAKSEGVTHGAISQIHQSALRRIRETL